MQTKNVHIFILLILFLGIYSCTSVRPYNKKFVEKFGNDNFSAFEGVGIVLRGVDKEDNPLLFISYIKDASTNGPCIVTIDKKTGEVKGTSCRLMKDSSMVDKTEIKNLALKFMKYNVGLLKVDNDQNVYINVISNERPSLIRFSDIKFKTGQYSVGWRNVKGLWFEYINN